MKKKETDKGTRALSFVNDNNYAELLREICELLEKARQSAARSVNSILTKTYWDIGKRIIENEQKGERRAEYGAFVLQRLSKDLTGKYGRGFSKENLRLMRLFFVYYQNKISQTASGIFGLSWSHYVRLLSIDEPHQRDFYEKEAGRAGWSVRQLDRQINSALYERLTLSKKKSPLLEEAMKSGKPQTAEEAIKDPYVLEFLGLPEIVSEKDLESALIKHLADFLLELGYGFTFDQRQYRLMFGDK